MIGLRKLEEMVFLKALTAGAGEHDNKGQIEYEKRCFIEY
jgi:hypothetical protein